ncbi:16S rRNA (uracil(1498)-N(3))-methyltransferase [Rossellomorea sp. KS-H15a]|uniref:16S rRNA (uracil(1498)-N(3))-methyltransferase n=1 Tax=Rossellomorea sp. KS-H15a TaxID=2963940 RepID=UPI0020C5CEF3|nr:16S rRNA (uracil(1498)-N(3))-methyltransferase [Rossellomorea sp. KS-H15a]UTE76391.1 16S rRNA (uracil(1498)-N(3))-methyltransferase [Rossellomorea sp. KS-H15a]
MQRYFIEDLYRENDPIMITGDDYHHIVRVMRMKEQDEVFVVFKDQASAITRIETITSDSVKLSIVQWETSTKELPIKVTIASGLPKGDKLELIFQKGTELGATQFIPFNADRSIVKWDEKKAKKKTERWEKIVKEAAEQSHRLLVPDVSAPVSMKQLIQIGSQFDYKLVAYEEEARAGEKGNLSKMLSSIGNGQSVLVVFGPEGGLSEKEIELLKSGGFLTCGLGPRILRTETAPLYVLSAISYQLELMR